MRSRLLTALALGATLTLAPIAAATVASATPSTVSPDDCFNSGGAFGGYNSSLQAVCVNGPYNGVPMDHDPLQGNCPTGQHIVLIYLQGFGCGADVPTL